MKPSNDAQTLLILKERELDLVMAIDTIRDTVVEPTTMLTNLTNVLADYFEADLCMLCLRDRDDAHLALKAVSSRGAQLDQLVTLINRELAEHVTDAPGVATWAGDTLPPALRDVEAIAGLQLAAIPIVMNQDERLGALILARIDQAFTPEDVILLKTAEDQIDSAVIQGYAYYDLQQRNKELETIYKIDKIRDMHLPLDQMLNAVLHELRLVIQAEMAFVMLYHSSGERLELRAISHDDLFRLSPYQKALERFAYQALHRAELIYENRQDRHNLMEDGLRSMMCVPLILQDQIIGVLGVANAYSPGGFDGEDRRFLAAIASQMDTAIFESLEKRRLREVLGRSVDPRVMERLLTSNDADFLKGERRTLTVVYADLRGSTRLAQQTDPELLVAFINDYLGQMTDVILSHEGTLDKFVGDEVMALFNAPFEQEDHALRAVCAGLDMQAAHANLMAHWEAHGVMPVAVGVGIATGELIVGEMGCLRRTDYTVIGHTANLGARICGQAQAGEVLMSQETYDMVKDQVDAEAIHGVSLKGFADGVTIYKVKDFRIDDYDDYLKES